MATQSARCPAPLWVHWLAILTVLAAIPLFFLGADVTTKGAGMADERAIVLPHNAIEEFATGERSHGWKIEHLHRLAGWFIGMCGIALAASLWIKECRRWVCWLGTVGLGLIIVQGLLGIFRVHLNALFGPNLAWVHGSFAPLVLATLMSVVVVTSPGWNCGCHADEKVRGLGWHACGLLYVQIILGGMVRHQDFFLGARLHLVMAFLATLSVFWFARNLFTTERPFKPWLLLGFVGLQVVLGVEAWINRFHHPVLPWNQVQPWPLQPAILRTLHFVVGAFLFATAVGVTVSLYRPTKTTGKVWEESPERKEEVFA